MGTMLLVLVQRGKKVSQIWVSATWVKTTWVPKFLDFSKPVLSDLCVGKYYKFGLFLLYYIMYSVWPEKNRQMSTKIAQKWFH